MKKVNTKIKLDDLSAGLYGIHLDRKNHRICKVMRILMLRKDFNDFLEELEEKGLKQDDVVRKDGKTIKLWNINFSTAGTLIRGYLEKVIQSGYIKRQNSEWVQEFLQIAETIILQTYLDGYANRRNKNNILSNIVIFDDSLNYPNITQEIFDRDTFWKVFDDAFYRNVEQVKEKYGKHPNSITVGGVKFDDLPHNEKLTPDDPKICQIVFDENTGKQELIDYIDKNWNSIEESLTAWRPKRKEKRITSTANFIRDTVIFNKYQSFKDEGYKNPDVKVYMWLMLDSDYKIEIEPNTVRKIVSLLKSEVNEINK